MKTYYLVCISVFSLLFFACGNSSRNKIEISDPQEAAQGEGQSLVVDTTKSIVHWKGFKPGGEHHGSLAIKSGDIKIQGTELKSGEFILDMNKIIDLDMEPGEMNDKLINHLKSADFFDVERYPEGKFTITSVEPLENPNDSVTHRVSGNLQLKDVEKNISIDTHISKDGNSYRAETVHFTIDRTQWNIQYGSKNIFSGLKDNFIYDDMEVHVIIVANAR